MEISTYQARKEIGVRYRVTGSRALRHPRAGSREKRDKIYFGRTASLDDPRAAVISGFAIFPVESIFEMLVSS